MHEENNWIIIYITCMLKQLAEKKYIILFVNGKSVVSGTNASWEILHQNLKIMLYHWSKANSLQHV